MGIMTTKMMFCCEVNQIGIDNECQNILIGIYMCTNIDHSRMCHHFCRDLGSSNSWTDSGYQNILIGIYMCTNIVHSRMCHHFCRD